MSSVCSPDTCNNQENACNSVFTDSEESNSIPRTDDISQINGKTYTDINMPGQSFCQSMPSPDGKKVLTPEEEHKTPKQLLGELNGLVSKQESKNSCKGSVHCGRMSDDQYRKIQGNYSALQRHIVNPCDVCRELFTAFVFNENDKRIIESKKDRSEQTDELIMTLTERGPNAFREFLLALSATGHYQAKQILEKDECKEVASIQDINSFVMEIKIKNPDRDRLDEMKDTIKKSLKKDYGCDATVTILSSGKDN